MRQRNFTEGPWYWDDTVWDYDPDDQAPWLCKVDSSETIITGEISCDKPNAMLIKEAPALFDTLEMLAEKHKCECGNPSCNRCEDYRMACEVLDRAALEDTDDAK